MNHDAESLDPVAIAAADWLARHDRGLTPDEQRAFSAWRAADPRHEAEWASMSATWTSLAGTSAASDLVAEAAAIDRRTRAAGRGPWRRWTRVALAAAAALALGWFLRPTSPTVEPGPAEPAVALIAAEARRVALADGSVVERRGESELKVELSAGQRRVVLEKGEAFFTVAPDRSRPFLVEADGVVVRAVGTAFNVRREAGRLDVMVTEGRIRIEPAAERAAESAPEVSAGGGARVRAVANAVSVETRALTPAELDTALAWRAPLLEFSRATLEEILEAFRTHTPHRVRLGDPQLAGRRISGTFQANNLEGFLRAGESMLGLRVERTAAGETVLYAAP